VKSTGKRPVREFEAALAAYWGIEHAIGVASVLDAIEISLKQRAQGRLGPPSHQELASAATSQAPLCGRVPQKQRNRVAVPSGEELGIQADLAAFCMYQRQK
jgi:hypothetical protein